MFFDFKITLGIWLYISAVLLTSACAHLFVNHLAESSQYVNQCLSYCPMQFEAIFTKNIDCWYKLEPPPRSGYNEYPQSMFGSKHMKNEIPCKPK